MEKGLLNIWLIAIVTVLFFVEFMVIQRLINPVSIIGLLMYGVLLAASIAEYRSKKKEEKEGQLLDSLLQNE